MTKRDLEAECWNAHDAATSDKDLPNCLKALDLIVKIRLAEGRVKDPTEKSPASDDLAAVHQEINS